MRHDLVTRIVEAYDARDKKTKSKVDVVLLDAAWAKALPGVERLVRKAARAALGSAKASR